MRAMILAAGFGTRLGALSDERPKPLLPVCDVPVIRYNLALLEAAGLREVVINLHHRGELIEHELGERFGAVAIRYSREAVILGTGGGIRQAADWLTDDGRAPFLVVNGKLVIDADLAALGAAHGDAAATMLLREVPDPERWGAIETRDGEVLRILGRGNPGDATRVGMFTGVHVISPSLAMRLPAGVESHVIHEGYVPALLAGERVAARFYDGYFEEHSTPRRYLDGNFALLRGEARLRHPPAPLAGVDVAAEVAAGCTVIPPVRVGPGARLEAGATVGPDVVVGRGAVVLAGARIERAVVWPGARVEGRVEQAIVTPRGVFPVEPPLS